MRSKIIKITFFILIIHLFFVSGAVSDSSNGLNTSDNITSEEALIAINNSQKIISELREDNFSVNYFEDILIEAERLYEQARLASILRNEVNSTVEEKQEAINSLRLVDWEDITFGDVVDYLKVVEERKKETILLFDKLTIEERRIDRRVLEIGEENSKIFDEARNILNSAKISFNQERYEEAEGLLVQARKEFELRSSEFSTLSGLRRNFIDFFLDYWIYISIIFLLLVILLFFLFKKLVISRLRKKINKIVKERKALEILIKEAQTERFKENKISGVVYNIRMKKYNERDNQIKQELPVLENRLNKILGKSKKKV